ncbi:HET-domain-containing protein [Sodiomyces alkalinus F11]|uniref:HET-domain-containing protein n=1 Tax=Sodiomyces alkalinus (strain CBS 110278 / VKM F-3762 / F11) TaxID=1314773 RepID=A0A3N2PUF5_SODAK|nr:HET-domain-containing protein [Sodiomyces alkalinus F11]ROT38148.1 HET-domain-containing protein [Sodiomyces alkalinus F11]
MDSFKRLFRKKVNSDCRCCQGLLGPGVWISATDLIQGSQAGCPACQLLYQSINLSDLCDPRIELVSVHAFGDSSVLQTFDPKSEGMSRQLYTQEGFHKGRWAADPSRPSHAPDRPYPPVERSVELFSLEGNTSHWPVVRAARHVAAVADAPECLDLIRTWVSDCEKKHRSCRKKKTPKTLPDRVILIRPGNDPQLVDSQGLPGRYIALSHRWGGNVSLQLTKDKLEDFKRGIPFSSFPKTFQDAIHICRALEVDYIWIDSICIIQDSKEDWDVQGSKMDQVYANCLLTLAADAAENGGAGFITGTERQDLSGKTRKLIYHGPQGEEGELFVRPLREFGSMGGFGRHYQGWAPQPQPEAETSSSQPSKHQLVEQGSYLLRRGWVLQETLLPRRMLHFLPNEVSWRCASASLCECQLRPHGNVAHAPLDLEQPREIDTEDLKEFWKEVVEQYTRRQLTFPSDRLAALAGMASRAQSVAPDAHYCAGLWSDALPSTLLWTVDRPVQLDKNAEEPASRRIDPAIAPSWSWASVTGYVLFLFWKRNYDRGRWAKSAPDLTDIQVQCTPTGQNRYGSVNVADAKLTALGYLCKVRLWLTGGSKWHFPFRMEGGTPGGTLGRTGGYLYPDTDEFLESLQASGKQGMSMTVVSVYGSRMFLVLRPVGEEEELVFERIGVLYCEEKDAVGLSEWGRRDRFTLV